MCCLSTASILVTVLNTKPNPGPEWLLKGHSRNSQYMTSITLLQLYHAQKHVMHNNFVGLFCLVFASCVLFIDLSTPTISLSWLQRELQIASKSVTEYCIVSHTYMRYNILGEWCKITQKPSPSIHSLTKHSHLQEPFISLPHQGLHFGLPAGVKTAAWYLKDLLASITISHAGHLSGLFIHFSQLWLQQPQPRCCSVVAAAANCKWAVPPSGFWAAALRSRSCSWWGLACARN